MSLHIVLKVVIRSRVSPVGGQAFVGKRANFTGKLEEDRKKTQQIVCVFNGDAAIPLLRNVVTLNPFSPLHFS